MLPQQPSQEVNIFFLSMPHKSQSQEVGEATILVPVYYSQLASSYSACKSSFSFRAQGPSPAVIIIYQLHTHSTQLKTCIPGSLPFHSSSYHHLLTWMYTTQTKSGPPRSLTASFRAPSSTYLWLESMGNTLTWSTETYTQAKILIWNQHFISPSHLSHSFALVSPLLRILPSR